MAGPTPQNFVSQGAIKIDMPGPKGANKQLLTVTKLDVKEDGSVDIVTTIGVPEGAGWRDKPGGYKISLTTVRTVGTEPEVDWNGIHHCNIYHYGFLRRTKAYAGKYRNLMTNINGSDRADPTVMDLLDDCAKDNKDWMKTLKIGSHPFTGKHPQSMVKWLKERGYGKTTLEQ